jgi:hypothetical protein
VKVPLSKPFSKGPLIIHTRGGAEGTHVPRHGFVSTMEIPKRHVKSSGGPYFSSRNCTNASSKNTGEARAPSPMHRTRRCSRLGGSRPAHSSDYRRKTNAESAAKCK